MSFLSVLFGRKYAAIGPTEASSRVDGGAVLLDVREASEWRAGHAPKARHIPLTDLDRRRTELPAGREIITVCRSGNRSARAAGILAADGHTVLNLSGGMRAWSAVGLPVVAKGGRPGVIT
jgi:rhodanese-related sulfurtransferase